MSIKVSVIIPVYNAADYLDECIQSLLRQTLQECEFIFINDGSTDDSRSVLESYQCKDSRIVIINQHNQGVSIARNKGILMANGDYIGFVDADDHIESDMYEVLYDSVTLSDCDVVVSNLESEIEGHRVVSTYPFPVDVMLDKRFIQQELMPYFLKSDHMNTAVNKLYKRKVIVDHLVFFPGKVALGEDGMFNILFFSSAESMIYIHYSGYHYREVSGSATRSIGNKDYFLRALEVFKAEPPGVYRDILPLKTIHQLKSIRLISNTMSYIYVYFKPNEEMSFWSRYSYVREMVNNEQVREALPIYYYTMKSSLGRYERLMVSLIKVRSTLGLWSVAAYSRFRNA